MKVTEVITEAAIPVISLQQARDGGMLGPLYHGTRADLNQIAQTGFDVSRSIPSAVNAWNTPVGSANGYQLDSYGYSGIAAPIHHLGFGIYFTTVKNIAKQFAGGTARGMKTFYLDSQNVERINFGSENTMMRWWTQNGYNMTPEATSARDMKSWIAATQSLTDTLASRCDAVWFLGKGIRRLLDGDQICVYRPELIRLVDPKMAAGWEIGSVVTHNQRVHYSPEFMQQHGLQVEQQPDGWTWVTRGWEDGRRTPLIKIPPPGMTGVITGKRAIPEQYRVVGGIDPRMANQATHWIDVKWKRGGVQHNYVEAELDPVRGG